MSVSATSRNSRRKVENNVWSTKNLLNHGFQRLNWNCKCIEIITLFIYVDDKSKRDFKDLEKRFKCLNMTIAEECAILTQSTVLCASLAMRRVLQTKHYS